MNSSRRGFLLGMLKVGVAAAIVPAASLMRVRPIVELTDPGHVHGVSYYDLTKGKTLFPDMADYPPEHPNCRCTTDDELAWLDSALREMWGKSSITPSEIYISDQTWLRVNGLLVPV